MKTNTLAFDVSRSLEDLEGATWPDTGSRTAAMVRLRDLRKAPVGEMRTSDLRLAVAQAVGLRWTVPIALARLDFDPTLAAEFHSGDLAQAVFRAPSGLWKSFPPMAALAHDVGLRLMASAVDMDLGWQARCLPKIVADWREFRKRVETSRQISEPVIAGEILSDAAPLRRARR